MDLSVTDRVTAERLSEKQDWQWTCSRVSALYHGSSQLVKKSAGSRDIKLPSYVRHQKQAVLADLKSSPKSRVCGLKWSHQIGEIRNRLRALLRGEGWAAVSKPDALSGCNLVTARGHKPGGQNQREEDLFVSLGKRRLTGQKCNQVRFRIRKNSKSNSTV